MIRIFLSALVFFLCSAPAVRSQEQISLTLTPPFLQLTIKPGDFWVSSLKVVNTNRSDLVVYPTVMDFAAEGEEGRGRFRPVISGETGNTLASWISVSPEPVVIAPEQSREIQFEVRIPEDAPPGGHYAAILVGTRPFASADGEGPLVRVSSFISSLFFVRVSGETVERGFIRDFSADRRFYERPEADFSLRFENTGNVHVQPQGHVTIYNMWGKERGKISLNERTDFGNVLPGSVRKFSMRWEGERNFFEVGRYTAIATLAFGSSARQSVSTAVSFWVIPVRETLAVLGGFAAFLLLLAWAVRRYVRKALELAIAARPGPVPAPTPRMLAAPLAETVVDLRTLGRERLAAPASRRRLLRKYAMVFLVILPLLLLGALWTAVYFRETFKQSRPFEAEVLRDEQTVPPAADR